MIGICKNGISCVFIKSEKINFDKLPKSIIATVLAISNFSDFRIVTTIKICNLSKIPGLLLLCLNSCYFCISNFKPTYSMGFISTKQMDYIAWSSLTKCHKYSSLDNQCKQWQMKSMQNMFKHVMILSAKFLVILLW